jgi:hypothetical protein
MKAALPWVHSGIGWALPHPFQAQGCKDVKAPLKDFTLKHKLWYPSLIGLNSKVSMPQSRSPGYNSNWWQTLVSFTWYWFVRYAESKNNGITEASTEISKEGLGHQTRCVSIRILWAAPERVICEPVRVKLKQKWRPQAFQDVKKWNICWAKPQAVSRTIPGKIPCELQLARIQ